MKTVFAAVSSVTATLALAASAHAADTYPNHPIRLVVPFPAGGATDVVARLMGQKAQEAAGQPFIIDNRGGAAGNIGSDNVAKSPGDGYHILQTVNALALGRALYHQTRVRSGEEGPHRRFHCFTASPLVIVANAKTGINSLQDLITRGRRQNPAR